MTITCPDLANLRASNAVRRGLEAIAAGGHHALFLGEKNKLKARLAYALAGLLPPLTEREAREVEAAYVAHTAACHFPAGEPFTSRPIRAVHASVSFAALMGFEGQPQPGEMALAHHGVLLLYGIEEAFRLNTLAHALHERDPAGPRPLIIGEMDALVRPQTHIAFQRFDVALAVPWIEDRLAETPPRVRGGPSSAVQARVVRARARMLARAGLLNAQLREEPLIRVARTLADLDESDAIDAKHLDEAASLTGFRR